VPALLFFAAILAIVLLFVWRALRRARRAEFIRSYVFPRGLFDALRQRHPQLTQKDCQLVALALRQFFGAYLAGGRRRVSMPSQVADDLWHAFILNTRTYQVFCREAFGGFMHHTPAATLGSEAASNEGLRRCWWQCCRAEHIDPRQPSRLPLLFAIDTKLNIAGGFRYAPDCGPIRAAAGDGSVVIHCGGDFSDGSFEGGTDGFGSDASGSGSDGGGGDGGGCSS
jgi:hypothetical protein